MNQVVARALSLWDMKGALVKLIAARELGLRVAMIKRPEMPDAPRVHTVDAALDWVRDL